MSAETDVPQFVSVRVCVCCRFEKMAESCKKSLEVLKLAQSRGLRPPKHHFEERSFHTVKWVFIQITLENVHLNQSKNCQVISYKFDKPNIVSFMF